MTKKLIIDVNKFISQIKIKKQYFKNLNQININHAIEKNTLQKKKNIIKYIIDITTENRNSFIHLIDIEGNVHYSSAGSLKFKKKAKRDKLSILKRYFMSLLKKTQILKKQQIAIHTKKTNNFILTWITRFLKKNFATIEIYNRFFLHPYNGCRKKKIRRKKFRTKRKKI